MKPSNSTKKVNTQVVHIRKCLIIWIKDHKKYSILPWLPNIAVFLSTFPLWPANPTTLGIKSNFHQSQLSNLVAEKAIERGIGREIWKGGGDYKLREVRVGDRRMRIWRRESHRGLSSVVPIDRSAALHPRGGFVVLPLSPFLSFFFFFTISLKFETHLQPLVPVDGAGTQPP